MKAIRPLLVMLATFMLLAAAAAAPSAPVAAPAQPLDTPIASPTVSGPCEGWSVAPGLPLAISASAVTSLSGYLYSFGGMTYTNERTHNAYKFDGNSWTAIASTPFTRTFASAVTDGRYIYIVNGSEGIYQNNIGTNTLFRYDPNTDSYTQLASSYHNTSFQSAVYANGYIYRIGGYLPNHNPQSDIETSSVEAYDIGTKQWSTLTNYPFLTYGPAAVEKDGYVYMMGGIIRSFWQRNAYRYNPTTEAWQAGIMADLPAQFFPIASGVLNNRLVEIGQQTATYIWDELTNSWLRGANAPYINAFVAGAVYSDSIYLVGGQYPYETVHRYSNTCPPVTATPTTTVTGTPPTATPTPAPACDEWQSMRGYPEDISANAVASLGIYLYSFGGSGRDGDVTTAYKFDGSTWTRIADLSLATARAKAISNGQYIYIIAGTALYRYDPATNSYVTLTPSPTTASNFAVAYLDGEIYRIGGDGSSSVYVYDIATDIWSQVIPYPEIIQGGVAVTLNGYIYTAGGFDRGYSIKTYFYDPTLDTWNDEAITDLPFPRSGSVSAVYAGEWLIAGGLDQTLTDTMAISWNPASNTWHALADNYKRSFAGGGATLGNSFYLVGGYVLQDGYNNTFYPSNDVLRYTNHCTLSPTATATITPAPPTATETMMPSATATATISPTETATPMPPATPTLCPIPFVDISGNVFYQAITQLYCRGVVSGTGNGYYTPAGSSTRAQFAKVVVLGFGLPLVTPNGGAQSFTDVLPSYFAYPYIEAGVAAGILSGYTAEQCVSAWATYPCFLPNKPITRAELTKLVVGATGYPLLTPTQPSFNDVPPSYFAYAYVETAHAHGIINGYPDGSFRPNLSIRRDEMAQIVYAAMSNL